jgi:hypothetical protein
MNKIKFVEADQARLVNQYIKCNLITLGGMNEVVLIVLTSVTDQK